jgi:hypothetical protein
MAKIEGMRSEAETSDSNGRFRRKRLGCEPFRRELISDPKAQKFT